MVALEAMALGRPVVATDLPAFREVLGEFAFYPAGDGFAGALERALACPPERLEAARAHARRFTWGQAAARLAEVIAAIRPRGSTRDT